MARSRIRRPELERTNPIRSLSGLWGAPPAGGTQAGDVGSSGNGAVQGGVDLGYRVIDGYLRQGMRVAQALSGRAASGAGTRNEAGLPQMVGMSGELMSTWLAILSGGLGGSFGASGATAPPPPDRTPTRAAPVAAQREPASAHVALDVTSSRPVEVTVDLRARTAGGALVVHDLRASDSALPQLRGVELVPGEQGRPLRIRLIIPEEQPPGIYSGVIVDVATSLPCGTICAQISA